MISYVTEMNRGFAGYYGQSTMQAHQGDEQRPQEPTCPCCKQPIPAPVEREWTVEEILAREG